MIKMFLLWRRSQLIGWAFKGRYIGNVMCDVLGWGMYRLSLPWIGCWKSHFSIRVSGLTLTLNIQVGKSLNILGILLPKQRSSMKTICIFKKRSLVYVLKIYYQNMKLNWWVSAMGDFVPEGTLSNMGRHFRFSQFGEWGTSDLVGRNKKCW